ncbi:hypothetical protein DYB37_013705 [Aphanomyces astaci]|uniref:NrS-1 polymerase-like helicase domain-containing protein n=1 Tax=Aphanomyces astaci TaxID=112090 RepID=A0A3R6WUF8_APHAT|nr:hypothetical protein DYB35_012666 [Aphanomyces astaci]RHZ17958.1 hypothetical protein DYB37_013705 [Aphanomyces astaci]
MDLISKYVIDNIAHIENGGKSVILTKTFNSMGQIEYTHMNMKAFRDVVAGFKIVKSVKNSKGEDESKVEFCSVAKASYSLLDRITWDRMDFVPYSARAGYDWTDRRVFNTFAGFVHPFKEDFVVDKSKIARFLEHILIIWADGNKLVYEAIMKVFAMYVQRPEQKTQLCLVMLGREGVGKNIITDILKNFVIGGRYVLETADMSKITQRFNGSVENKLLCVLDEAASVNGKDSHKDQEALKALINSTNLVVEKKGAEPYTIQDRCNYICFSNNDYVIKASTEMRRFAYCRVSDLKIGNAKYFKDLYADFDKYGAGIHLYHYLMNLDVSDFVPQRDFPMTAAKAEMQRDAVDKPIQWMVASINEEVETELRFIDGFNPNSHLLAKFNDWLRSGNAAATVWSDQRFAKSLSKFLGANTRQRVNGVQTRGYALTVKGARTKIKAYTRRTDLFHDDEDAQEFD